MYEVNFCEDKNSSQPVNEVMIELRDKAQQERMPVFSIKRY